MIFNVLNLSNATPQQAIIFFIIMLVAFLFSLSVHEFAHAFTAHKMGDLTPKLRGRLTLNPFKHLDLSGFLMFMFLGVGWAKPVPINPTNFKKYRTGIKWVSIAGVLANFILGLICAIIYAILIATVGAPTEAMAYVYVLLTAFMVVNSMLIMFNLIPLYPLDGFNFITAFMKGSNKFIHFVIKNGFKILLTILLLDTIIYLFFNVGIIDSYLNLIYRFIFYPITGIGV